MTEHNSDYQADFLNCDLGVELSAEEVSESFEFFDSWEDRYRFVIDLGKKLAPLPDALHSDENILHGCQSQVWIDYYFHLEQRRLYFLVDSEAHIVRGLAAIVLAAYNGKTPEQIEAVNIDSYLDGLDLIRHVSPTRGNGLRSMIGKIRAIADRYQN